MWNSTLPLFLIVNASVNNEILDYDPTEIVKSGLKFELLKILLYNDNV